MSQADPRTDSTAPAKALFVIGPQRAGTTWIYQLFAAQPAGIFLDRVEKENYFFSKANKASATDLRQKFERKLSGSGAVDCVVDVCSTYFAHPDALASILAAYPEAHVCYIHRDPKSREASFRKHRRFNRFSTAIIGYHISWQLFRKQADFDAAETQLRSTVPGNRLLRLEFDDLARDGGGTWTRALSEFIDIPLRQPELGVVNQARTEPGPIGHVVLIGYRAIQRLRLHIPARKLRQKLSGRRG